MLSLVAGAVVVGRNNLFGIKKGNDNQNYQLSSQELVDTTTTTQKVKEIDDRTRGRTRAGVKSIKRSASDSQILRKETTHTDKKSRSASGKKLIDYTVERCNHRQKENQKHHLGSSINSTFELPSLLPRSKVVPTAFSSSSDNDNMQGRRGGNSTLKLPAFLYVEKIPYGEASKRITKNDDDKIDFLIKASRPRRTMSDYHIRELCAVMSHLRN